MATKIRCSTHLKKVNRFRKKKKIRSRIQGMPQRPRMSVFRSNRYVYVQLIDDVSQHTLASASTLEKDFPSAKKHTVESAKILGGIIAKRAFEKDISQVVFDRNGYPYHGIVKALAESAREEGLKI